MIDLGLLDIQKKRFAVWLREKRKFIILFSYILGMESNEPADSCLASFEWTCPKACKCADGIADCRQKKLTTIPKHFPEDTTEM